jgi:hypothetical protein
VEKGQVVSICTNVPFSRSGEYPQETNGYQIYETRIRGLALA